MLELFAVDRGVTYQRVLFWVKAANSHPVKAEFYTASGRLLKTALYEKFERMAGKLRPTRLVMEDALRKGEQSVLDYSGDEAPRPARPGVHQGLPQASRVGLPHRPKAGAEGIIYNPFMGIWTEIPTIREARYNDPLPLDKGAS